jgi:NADPH-dependent curcumin reductase CurA
MSEQTLPTTALAWHLDTRPEGRPNASDFSLREVDLPAPGPGPGGDRTHSRAARPVDARKC